MRATATQDMEQLLTVEEVARMLGLAVRTVYGLVHYRRIPAVRISRRCVRFDPAAIAAWVKEKSADAEPRTAPRRRRGGPQKSAAGVSSTTVEAMIRRAKEEVLHGQR